MRKTCPVCRQRWPNGKDPVEADAGNLMSLRIGDLVKGLSVHSQSLEAEIFGEPCRGEMGLGKLAERLYELEEASYLLSRAQERLESAKASLAATPLAMTAIEYIEEHGVKHECGLEHFYAVDVVGYRVMAATDRLLITDLEEIEDDH